MFVKTFLTLQPKLFRSRVAALNQSIHLPIMASKKKKRKERKEKRAAQTTYLPIMASFSKKCGRNLYLGKCSNNLLLHTSQKRKTKNKKRGGRSNNLPAKKKKTKKRGATYQVPANSFILNFSIPSTSSFPT